MNFSKLTKTALFSLAVVIVGAGLAFSVNLVLAQWMGPNIVPPTGNVAVTLNTGPIAQTKSGALTVSGNSTDAKGLMVGGAGVVVKGNENLIYGNTDTTSTGNLLLLQKNDGNDAFFQVTSAGDVSSSGCFGSTFDHLTATAYNGSLNGATSNGYYAANALCGNGQHICSTQEILESIKCADNNSPIKAQGKVSAWISNGPPGYFAPADCAGWTLDRSFVIGQVWSFNTKGGSGKVASCDQTRQFACCK